MTAIAPGALRNLARLVRDERSALMKQWRAEVRALPSAASLDAPTLDDHIPDSLTTLATACETGALEHGSRAESAGTPPEHGQQRVING